MNNLKNIKHRRWLQLTGVVLLLCSLSACTYDYFVDETNYYLYVPQIKKGTVDDFTLALFDNSGKISTVKHYTKENIANNEILKSGIIKLTVKPGDYTVSCFSGTHTSDNTALLNVSSISTNASQSQAYVGLLNSGTAKDLYLTSPDFMTIQNGLKAIKVPFLNQHFNDDGTPVKDSDTLTVERYCGLIKMKISGMTEANLSQVDMVTNGLSTNWILNGTASRQTTADAVHATYKKQSTLAGNQMEFEHKYFPSFPGSKLSTNIYFTLTNGSVATLNISEADFMRLAGVDQLNSGQAITITIQNLLLTNITIEGWDDDIQGGGDEDM